MKCRIYSITWRHKLTSHLVTESLEVKADESVGQKIMELEQGTYYNWILMSQVLIESK